MLCGQVFELLLSEVLVLEDLQVVVAVLLVTRQLCELFRLVQEIDDFRRKIRGAMVLDQLLGPSVIHSQKYIVFAKDGKFYSLLEKTPLALDI